MKDDEITLEIRRLLYNYILSNPGAHMREISKNLDIPLGTLRYHLAYLEKKGLIISKKERNLKVYFVSRKLSTKDKNIALLLHQKRFRDIILLIIAFPGVNHSEISSRLSIKPSTLSKYIKILLGHHIVYYKKIGREKRYYIINEKHIIELLLSYKKSFWDTFVDNILEIYFER